jgi:hypothetical protein
VPRGGRVVARLVAAEARDEQPEQALHHPEAGDDEAADDAAGHAYELRLLRMMRSQLVDDRSTVFVGPTGMVDEAVRGAMRNVVGALAELVHDRELADPDRLCETAAAANAWVRTFVDLRAVVAFNFDPEAEPSRPW